MVIISERKTYTLFIKDTSNPKLLNSLLLAFIDFFKEFCTVDLVVQEKKRYNNKGNRQGKGLDPWIN